MGSLKNIKITNKDHLGINETDAVNELRHGVYEGC